MKILIIAIPRTGSSNLLYDLAIKHNLKPIYEPFDGSGRAKYIKNEDNIVLKTMIFQTSAPKDLISEFDEIILLSRKNLIECAQSYAYFSKNKKNGFKSYYSYFYENVEDDEFQQIYDRIQILDSSLKKLSKEVNIPITYYEDIYDLNNKERLRKFDKKQLQNKMI